MAAAQDVAVCAPLQGAAHSQCINDQLGRGVVSSPRPSPRPVPPVAYPTQDPTLRLPSAQGSLADQTARDLEAAQRDSVLRNNLLRQQIQKDLTSGPHGVPPLRPVAPMQILP